MGWKEKGCSTGHGGEGEGASVCGEEILTRFRDLRKEPSYCSHSTLPIPVQAGVGGAGDGGAHGGGTRSRPP